MKKELALKILEEIQQSLLRKNPKENTLKIINFYKSKIEASTNFNKTKRII